MRLPILFPVVGSLALTACGAQIVTPAVDATPPRDAQLTDVPFALDAIAPDAFVPDVTAPVDVPTRDAPPFTTAEHEPFPTIPDLGGPRIANPQVVVITYADDPLRDEDERYVQWMVSSDWVPTVGTEYGVTGASLLGTVRLTDAAPNAITSTEIEALIARGIESGQFPMGTEDAIYMIFFPANTQITMLYMGDSALSCESFGGYHGVTAAGPAGTRYAYAAIPTCAGGGPGISDTEYVQIATSHEFIEAATDLDPLHRPAFRFADDTISAWAVLGGEVADLCFDQYWRDGSHIATRVWSNAAAAAGGDPCVPSNGDRAYFNVSSMPDEIRVVSPGDDVEFTLTGWSTAPIADWTLQLFPTGNAGIEGLLGTSRMNNGRSTTLRAHVPADAASGTWQAYVIYSFRTANDFHAWPVAFFVQ
jgi:hypothetical protein